MTNITLDDALRLLEQKKVYLEQLSKLRNGSAVVHYEEGDTEDFINRPERSVDDLSAEINFVQKQIRSLHHAITKANIEIETDFEWEGEKQKLGELILLVREWRKELPYLTSLSNHKNLKRKDKQRELINGQWEYVTKILVTEVTYDPKDYKKRVENLDKMIAKAQATINKLNVDTFVDFELVEWGTSKDTE